MEKQFEVRFANQALEQIKEIYRYIAESLCAPDTAAKWMENLKEETVKFARSNTSSRSFFTYGL